MLTLESQCLQVVGGGVIIRKNSAKSLNQVQEVRDHSFIFVIIQDHSLQILFEPRIQTKYIQNNWVLCILIQRCELCAKDRKVGTSYSVMPGQY